MKTYFICKNCKIKFNYMFYVSDKKWQKVADKKDTLCANCFLEKFGGFNWYFVRVPGDKIVEMLEKHIENM